MDDRLEDDPVWKSAASWARLHALRQRFLADDSEDYWTPGDAELYDATVAQRSGWKGDGVTDALDRRGWRPAARRILDWGCGTGVAARVVAAWSGIREVLLYDQSPLALNYALQSLRAAGAEAGPFRRGEGIPADTLLVISHVAGELSDGEMAELAAFAAAADEVIWIEPGSREISLRLTGARAVLQAGGHHTVAPCTHEAACPMNPEGRDWCHFFALPPPEVFQSAFWSEFSHRLGIDLRALPFSFLAASKRDVPAWPAGAERMIGHPRVLKGRCEMLCCGPTGLATRELQKRDAPDLFRSICREGARGVFEWDHDPVRPQRVTGGRAL